MVAVRLTGCFVSRKKPSRREFRYLVLCFGVVAEERRAGDGTCSRGGIAFPQWTHRRDGPWGVTDAGNTEWHPARACRTPPTPVLCRVAKSTFSVCPGRLAGRHGVMIMNLTCRSLFQTDACMHLVHLGPPGSRCGLVVLPADWTRRST